MLVYGALSSEPTPFPLFTVLGKSLTLKGYLYAEIVADPEALERAKAFILQGLKSGALRPIIAKTFALSDIQDAHRFLEANQQIGKIVERKNAMLMRSPNPLMMKELLWSLGYKDTKAPGAMERPGK